MLSISSTAIPPWNTRSTSAPRCSSSCLVSAEAETLMTHSSSSPCWPDPLRAHRSASRAASGFVHRPTSVVARYGLQSTARNQEAEQKNDQPNSAKHQRDRQAVDE